MRQTLTDLVSSIGRIHDITTEIDNNIAMALRDPNTLQRHETTQCAITVILSGYFESFLKDVAESFIADVCNRNIPFTALPDRMRRTHFEDGGSMLSNKVRNRVNWVTSSADDIARRIGSVVAPVPYELVWEAFADTKANPSPATIKEYMSRFGIQNPWGCIAVKVADRDASLSESWLKASLGSFIDIRNECAHSGRASITPTPSQIRDYCSLLKQIAEAIVEVLEDHLSSLSPQPSGSSGHGVGPVVSLPPATNSSTNQTNT